MTFAELVICKGVGPVQGDTASAEQPIEVLNLLNPSGFSVQEDGWIPKLPQTKGGGVYLDNPTTDGRTPVAYSEANVTEVMKLTATGASLESRYWMESQLLRFRQAAHDFHTTDWQIEPVYLKWWAHGAPGPQYALIYSIDIAPNSDPFASNVNELTITIEREFGWRAVRPGGNPKEWTAEVNSETYAMADYDMSSIVASVSKSLVSGNLGNALEWTDDATISRFNFLDIPANKIPGDLPALAFISTSLPLGTVVFVARNSKETTLLNREGSIEHQYFDFSAAVVPAGGLGTDTSLATDTGGALYPPASANYRRAEISFATVATDLTRLTWANFGGTARPLIGLNALRGRFRALLRCRQHNGAFGDVKIRLRVGIGDYEETVEVSPTVATGTGNTTDWPLTDMGIINIPVNHKVGAGVDGRGLYSRFNSVGAENLKIHLNARRTTGVSVLYVCDLILIPIDEQLVRISDDSGAGGVRIFVDTTGYISRGTTEGVAGSGNANFPFYEVELRGNGITLVPGRNNRLYFFGCTSTNTSNLSGSFAVTVNIIPRWSGVRDV